MPVYRYEKKFFVESVDAQIVQSYVLSNDAQFYEAYPSRIIQSCYFDTADLKSFYDNVEGLSHRKKYRFRWYGRGNRIQKGQFEIKVKKDEWSYKEIYPFSFDRSLSVQELFTEAGKQYCCNYFFQREETKKIATLLLLLQATVHNVYKREYYQSSLDSIRLTIDKDISFSSYAKHLPVQSSQASILKDIGALIELKFPTNLLRPAQHIASTMPFRMTRSSKYVTGMESVLYGRSFF